MTNDVRQDFATGVIGDATADDINEHGAAINKHSHQLDGADGDAVLKTPTFEGFTEKVQDLGTVGSTATIGPVSDGTIVIATLTDNTPCTITPPTAPVLAADGSISILLLVIQPASGTPTTATISGVEWSGGAAPTITATLGATDVIPLVGVVGRWLGNIAQDFS